MTMRGAAMGMTLQEAIDFMSDGRVHPFGIDVLITISMHDENHHVLSGAAFGDSSMFHPDLPLQHPDASDHCWRWAHGDGWRRPVGTGVFNPRNGHPRDAGSIPSDFSVRTGHHFGGPFGRGPSVQIEIVALSPLPLTRCRAHQT